MSGIAKLYTDYAALYDIAFDWDVSAEVEWLLERLGPECRSVLEPGCGSGRILEAFAAHGVEVAGIDSSPAMVTLARQRLRRRGAVQVADMTGFDLRRKFDGAVSPINTLLYLSPAQLQRHFDAMTRHLEPGARYLVQVGLVDPEQCEPFASSEWEASRGDTQLRIEWIEEELDVVGGRSRQRSRIHIIRGPRAGEVIEEVHNMTAWTPQAWHAAISMSQFTEVAKYDGAQKGVWPRVEAAATGGMLWHELELGRKRSTEPEVA